MSHSTYLCILFALVVLLCSVEAHNGTMAVAVPVEGIVVDGDLSDWPAAVPSHPILEDGIFKSFLVSPPRSLGPYSSWPDTLNWQPAGQVRFGYEPDSSVLYVGAILPRRLLSARKWLEDPYLDMIELAVEDWCEVELQPVHFDKSQGSRSDTIKVKTFRYEIQGKSIVADGIDTKGVTVESGTHPDSVIFEWRFDLASFEDSAKPYRHAETLGFALGLRASMLDKTERRFSSSPWSLSWGNAEALPGRGGLGDLLLSANEFSHHEIVGQIQENFLRALDRRSSEAWEEREETGLAGVSLLMVGGIAIAFGLLNLFLFVFYPNSKQPLFFSFFAVFVGGAMISYYLASVISVSPTAVTVVLIAAALISGLRFLYSVFRNVVPSYFKYAVVLAALFTCILVAEDLSNDRSPEYYDYVGWGVAMCLVACFVESLRMIGVAVYKRHRGSVILGIGFIGGLITLALGVAVELLDGDWGRFHGAPFTLGALVMLTSTSIHLARNVAFTSRSLERRVDEVQELSEENLAKERALRARMEKELEEARQLQLSLLPHEQPVLANLELAWHMETATEVGGDYYDYSLADGGILTLALGDATGHGMDSGVVVTGTKSLFQTFADAPDIADSLTVMSRSLKGMNLPRMGMAMTLLRMQGSTCRVSSAGMPPVLIYRADTGAVDEVQVSGYPLGMSDTARYEEESFEVSSGDAILMMSDGLPERLNPRDEYFNYDRTKAVFAEAASGSPEELCNRMLQSAEEWAESRPQDDDITLVALKAK